MTEQNVPYYQPRVFNKTLINLYKDIQDCEDKVEWLKNNKSALEEFDVNLINLINAWMHNDWPMKRDKKPYQA